MNLKRPIRKWHAEKRNAQSRDRRFWDIGADLTQHGSLRIYRLPSGASREGNKCLVLHQLDTEQAPEALEIIQEAESLALAVRQAEGEQVTASIHGNGIIIGDVRDSSSESLKENFQNMGDSVIQKIIKNLVVRRYNMKGDTTKRFGATAENFHEVTGLGSNDTIAPGTVAFLAIRMIQDLQKKLVAIEAKLDKATAKKDLKEGDDLPKA